MSLDKIVTAALEILDQEGLDALTMRRVAEKLRTARTSLYPRTGRTRGNGRPSQ